MKKIDITAQNLIYSNDLFDLNVEVNSQNSQLLMILKSEHLDTGELPLTFKIIKEKLPRVLDTKCFNGLGLPFCEEVKNTEIGHLFEHILIAYLCEARETKGCETCTYSGQTNWNWTIDNEGIFHISLSTTLEDMDIFSESVEKAISLTSAILNSKAIVSVKNKAAVH